MTLLHIPQRHHRLSPHRSATAALVVALAGLLTSAAPPAQAIDLADAPLFSSASVPGNLLLALSVEWPTASTPAYTSTTAYTPATVYVGYFDPEKCYRYLANTVTPANSYFVPHGPATAHACTSTTTAALWSGNWLNWTSTQSIDAFRWTLTGGTRMAGFDTPTLTVLQKTYHGGMGGRQGFYPDKLTSNGVSGATPFTWGSAITRISGMGHAMVVSANLDLRCNFSISSGTATYSCNTQASGTNTCTTANPDSFCTVNNANPAYSVTCGYTRGGSSYLYTCTSTQAGGNTNTCTATVADTSASSCKQADPAYTNYTGQSSAAGTDSTSAFYRVYIQLQACDPAVGLETNCVPYASSYKPEGLMQKYASKLRYSAFGYLNDSAASRDGGVMRSRMKYIGPSKPVPGSVSLPNATTEWDATTGVMLLNPDTADAAATTARALAETGLSAPVVNSGVMNYLNKFGLFSHALKSYDPVSELYYAGLRYYRKLGPVASYSTFTGITSTGTLTATIDDFPVITTWDDPILYSCQKNFILGIGDINTWNDSNLQGSTIRTNEPTMPAAVTADTEVNVKTSTGMVGQLEGAPTTNLGSYSSGRNNSFFIAGLAYDAHTRDIRSDLAGTQTVNTYWVDVLEGQSYSHRNQYWLAAKYGGFEVPAGFSPYATTNSTTTLPQAAWYTNTDTLPGSSTYLRPDNYFTGGQATQMVSGLSRAFAKIAAEASAATSTAFSSASLNEAVSGNASFSASYDPKYWTGTLIGTSVSYASDGTPSAMQVWNARDLLGTTLPDNRKIVTCCTATGAGLPFRLSNLNSAVLSARTNWSTFANVPGVAAASQSAASFLDYLRGVRTNETSNGGAYRSRSYVFGDIVNSKVTVVAAPQSPYYDVTNPGYNAFRRTYSARKSVVYVGANDGMLHAFDGGLAGATKGTELLAYVPSFVYGTPATAPSTGLAALGNPSYEHRFYVDATPQVFDVDFLRVSGMPAASATQSDWRSVLVGGLGKGGRGYYALDVTSPTTWTSETTAATKVLWEYTDSTMGQTYGDARIVKTAKYGWTAVIPSGYNTPDGSGALHLVNPKTGVLLEKIVLPGGTPAAPLDVAHVTAFLPDLTDYTATALYAGDMQGHVWRVDVSADSGSYPAPLVLAQLSDASGTPQPITTPVRVMVEPNSGKRYLLVGTGRLLADSDIASTQKQTFYAIIDGTTTQMYTATTLPTGVSFPITRSKLNQNTDLLSGIGSAPTQPMGWYRDLGSDSASGIAERITVAPVVNNGLVGVAINLPNGQACTPSGTSTVMAVNFADGKSVLVDGGGSATALTPYSTGVASDLTFKNIGGKVRLISGRSDGSVNNLPGTYGASNTLRRLNWREVPTAN
ncbi:pilus assembly protein [Sphaerotilus sp.]|uniref:pilus assembly protein n=1 Tax=Sphaerotilus sp. TaxID=2093942 RepID=UPI0025EF4953|nr:PilC/PilY family type IV pilus protein [Sphaerotilus sp.]